MKKPPADNIFLPSPTCTCQRCGYLWIPRTPPELIKACPRCKSYKWNEYKKPDPMAAIQKADCLKPVKKGRS